MPNLKTDVEKVMQEKQDRARGEVQEFINQYASANATEDLMRTINIEVIEYQGQDRTIIRDSKTNAILDYESMLEKFRKERPSYLYTDEHSRHNKPQQNNENTGVSESYIVNIINKILNGEIKRLSQTEKDSIRSTITKLGGNVSTDRIKIGNRNYMECFRIFQKAGGLV